jgi:hypothetical protein
MQFNDISVKYKMTDSFGLFCNRGNVDDTLNRPAETRCTSYCVLRILKFIPFCFRSRQTVLPSNLKQLLRRFVIKIASFAYEHPNCFLTSNV